MDTQNSNITIRIRTIQEFFYKIKIKKDVLGRLACSQPSQDTDFLQWGPLPEKSSQDPVRGVFLMVLSEVFGFQQSIVKTPPLWRR